MLMCLQFRIENSLTSVTFYVFFAVVSSFLKETKNKNKTKKKTKKHQREPLLHVLLFVNEKTYLSVTIK